MQRRAQSWSTDVVLGVVIFGFVVVAFTSFALLQKPSVQQLQGNAERVMNELQQSQGAQPPVLNNTSLDNQSLAQLYASGNYQTIRDQLKIKGNFCIYVEDQSGQVVSVAGRNGWGSNELLIGGKPCGTPLS